MAVVTYGHFRYIYRLKDVVDLESNIDMHSTGNWQKRSSLFRMRSHN